MLGLTPSPRTLAAALRDIEHKRLEVRLSALRDLTRLGKAGADAEGARAALARALRVDASVAIRSEAAVALADVEAKDRVTDLLEALEDPAARVRQMVFVALAELASPGHSAVVKAVLAASRDEVPQIRFQALIAAKRVLTAERSRTLVQRAFGDDDPEVRYIAWRLAEDLYLETSAPLPADVSKAALAALRDESSAVSLAAAILLCRSGREDGESTIVELINHPAAGLFAEDEQTAIELCAELGLRDAASGLERRAFALLSRSPFQWHARVALAKLGHRRARRELLRGLDAWSRDARTMAAEAVGRAGLAEAIPRLEAMAQDSARADPQAVASALAAIRAAPATE